MITIFEKSNDVIRMFEKKYLFYIKSMCLYFLTVTTYIVIYVKLLEF